MVNPGSFQGSRKEFLIGEMPTYSLAVAGGYAAEAVSGIQQRYFKRYPIDLPHNEEPTVEHLEAVDDEAPDPENVEPDKEKLSEEEFELAVKAMEARKKSVKDRKAQIKRWLGYRHSKEHEASLKPQPRNPYSVFIQKLTGKECTRPRLKTGVNVWRKTQREVIEAELQAMIPPVKTAYHATTRDEIARRRFSELDIGEQNKWRKAGEDEHKAAMAQFNKDMEAEPSTDPEERQRSIQGLVEFMQPILDTVCKATGWKASLIAGGPEPAQDGALNIISMHSGMTSGDVAVNFGQLERARYKKAIVPIFGSFLQKCYTPVECRSRALPKDMGFLSLSSSFDYHESVATMHSLDPSQGASLTSTTPSVSVPPASSTAHTLPSETFTPPLTSTKPSASVPTTSSVVHSLPSTTADLDHSNPFPYRFDDDFDIDQRDSSPPGSRCVSPTPSLTRQSAPPSPSRTNFNMPAVSAPTTHTSIPPPPQFLTPTATFHPTTQPPRPVAPTSHSLIQPPRSLLTPTSHPSLQPALWPTSHPIQPPRTAPAVTSRPSIQPPRPALVPTSHPSIQPPRSSHLPLQPPRSSHPSIQTPQPGLTPTFHPSIQPRARAPLMQHQPSQPSLNIQPPTRASQPSVPAQSMQQPPASLCIRIPAQNAPDKAASPPAVESERGSKRVSKKSEKVLQAESAANAAKEKASSEKAAKVKKKTPASKAKAPAKTTTASAEKEKEKVTKKGGKRAATTENPDPDAGQEDARPGKRARVPKVRK